VYSSFRGTQEVTRNDKGLNKIHIWGGGGEDSSGITYNMMLQPDVTTVLPPSLFTIQVWDTSSKSITKTLIGQGYDVILSNTDYVYLDCGNSGSSSPGGYWCQPYHEWFHIYQYINDVTAKWNLTDADLKHVTGSETLIWTEMVDDNNLSQKLWPRSAALAESLWTSPKGEDTYFAAAGRMLHWRELMKTRGIFAEAMQPLWCSQRDPYACAVHADTPQ
jgi:hexosaminidase